jgi:hypothetical protein
MIAIQASSSSSAELPACVAIAAYDGAADPAAATARRFPATTTLHDAEALLRFDCGSYPAATHSPQTEYCAQALTFAPEQRCSSQSSSLSTTRLQLLQTCVLMSTSSAFNTVWLQAYNVASTGKVNVSYSLQYTCECKK